MHESYEYRYAWERNDEVYLEVLIGLLLNIEGPSQASEEPGTNAIAGSLLPSKD